MFTAGYGLHECNCAFMFTADHSLPSGACIAAASDFQFPVSKATKEDSTVYNLKVKIMAINILLTTAILRQGGIEYDDMATEQLMI